jgi:hypothetical protein
MFIKFFPKIVRTVRYKRVILLKCESSGCDDSVSITTLSVTTLYGVEW